MVTLKPYQTQQLNLPLIRSQNISGIVYLDKNSNQTRDEGEVSLGAIPILLQNNQGQEIQRTYTSSDGVFIFYQLAPETYQLTIDSEQLPEDIALPPGFAPLTVDANRLEELPPLEIGLVPFEKPIEIVVPSAEELIVTLDQELVTTGQTLKISIESKTPLKRLELLLPTGEKHLLVTSNALTKWTYQWKVPATAPTGQVKIVCQAEKSGR